MSKINPADFLENILAQKRKEIQALYDQKGIAQIAHFQAQITLNSSWTRPFFFQLSKPGLNLISEVKKASPSKGIIRADFDPVALAHEFQNWGASAISVLTDEAFFQGSIEFLKQIHSEIALPLLRKDFIIDPIQVYEAKAAGASAILIIKAICDNVLCQSLVDLAHSLQLDVLLEVHTLEECQSLETLNHVDIIGINNRNLRTFEVNISTTSEIGHYVRDHFPANTVLVAESGYSEKNEMDQLQREGFNAVLIGEGLAKRPDLLHYFR